MRAPKARAKISGYFVGRQHMTSFFQIPGGASAPLAPPAGAHAPNGGNPALGRSGVAWPGVYISYSSVLRITAAVPSRRSNNSRPGYNLTHGASMVEAGVVSVHTMHAKITSSAYRMRCQRRRCSAMNHLGRALSQLAEAEW